MFKVSYDILNVMLDILCVMCARPGAALLVSPYGGCEACVGRAEVGARHLSTVEDCLWLGKEGGDRVPNLSA